MEMFSFNKIHFLLIISTDVTCSEQFFYVLHHHHHYFLEWAFSINVLHQLQFLPFPCPVLHIVKPPLRSASGSLTLGHPYGHQFWRPNIWYSFDMTSPMQYLGHTKSHVTFLVYQAYQVIVHIYPLRSWRIFFLLLIMIDIYSNNHTL